MHADGSHQRQLTNGNRAEVPAFPPGRIVFSRQSDDGTWHTWRVNPGRAQRKRPRKKVVAANVAPP